MNLVMRVIHRIHRIFSQNPDLFRDNRKEIELLREKILNGKKKDLNKLKKTNGRIRIMIERGEFSFKIVK